MIFRLRNALQSLDSLLFKSQESLIGPATLMIIPETIVTRYPQVRVPMKCVNVARTKVKCLKCNGVFKVNGKANIGHVVQHLRANGYTKVCNHCQNNAGFEIIEYEAKK